MIRGFQAILVPAFSADGLVLDFPMREWSVAADEISGTMRFSCRGHQITKRLQDVLVFQIQNAKEITDVKSTVSRMALTGIGAHLFTNRSGVGAGLLDLSFRGAIQKGIVSGAVAFRDLTYVSFQLEASQLELLAPHLPENCATDERLQESAELEDLFVRMKMDGLSVLEELADEIVELSQSVAAIQNETNSGKTFAERDAARQRFDKENTKFDRVRSLFFALLYANKISLNRFVEETKQKCPQFSALNIPDGLKTAVLVLPERHIDSHEESDINDRPDLASAVKVKWSLFWSIYHQFEEAVRNPTQETLAIPIVIVAFVAFVVLMIGVALGAWN